MRFALLIALLYSFTVFALEGFGLDPHGTPRRAVVVHTDGAGGSDPNG